MGDSPPFASPLHYQLGVPARVARDLSTRRCPRSLHCRTGTKPADTHKRGGGTGHYRARARCAPAKARWAVKLERNARSPAASVVAQLLQISKQRRERSQLYAEETLLSQARRKPPPATIVVVCLQRCQPKTRRQ